MIRVWFAPESVWTQTPKGSTPCLFLTSPTEPTCTGSCVRCSGSIGSYSSYPVRAYDQIKFACRAYSYCIDVVCMCSARRHFCSVRASLVSALRHRPPPASANCHDEVPAYSSVSRFEFQASSHFDKTEFCHSPVCPRARARSSPFASVTHRRARCDTEAPCPKQAPSSPARQNEA